jgi:hypothetical protein
VIVGPGAEPPHALLLADTSTGTLTPLAPDAGRSLGHTPDGRRLVFVDEHVATRWVIAAVAPGDAAPTELVATPVVAGEPADARSEDFCWLPDGTLLMAHGARLLRWDGHAGTSWQTLADLPDLGGDIKRLAVSPDGAHLAFVVQIRPR